MLDSAVMKWPACFQHSIHQPHHVAIDVYNVCIYVAITPASCHVYCVHLYLPEIHILYECALAKMGNVLIAK